MRVLAVDPGREKCGLAVMDPGEGILARGVVPSRVIDRVVRDWARSHRVRLIVVGGGTSSRQIRRALSALDLPMEVQPEEDTTRRARQRYFEENPPRGWRRLIPRGLLLPPVPVDDYAAVLIGEGYLRAVAAAEAAEAAAALEEMERAAPVPARQEKLRARGK